MIAGLIAIHLRGLGEIEYEILRKVSDYYFSIPSYALKEALTILAEIEYVQLVTKGTKILSAIPDVPRFQDLYEGVGNYFTFSDLNEHEQGTLLILSELQNKPENKDRLLSFTGIDMPVFTRCMEIGTHGNYLKEFRAGGEVLWLAHFISQTILRNLWTCQ